MGGEQISINSFTNDSVIKKRAFAFSKTDDIKEILSDQNTSQIADDTKDPQLTNFT